MRGCLFGLLLYTAAICQYQTVKNFTVTDYNNNSHTLYTYISNNQHVLVEFTVTN